MNAEPRRDENTDAGRPLRRSEILAWSGAAAFASLVAIIAIDAATGGGISVRADVTLALVGGMLGGLWRTLPRAAPTELRGSVRDLLIGATDLLLTRRLRVSAPSPFGLRTAVRT
jgi:hypothetical protein